MGGDRADILQLAVEDVARAPWQVSYALGFGNSYPME